MGQQWQEFKRKPLSPKWEQLDDHDVGMKMIEALKQYLLSGRLNLLKRAVVAVDVQPLEFTVRADRWQVDDADPRWNLQAGKRFPR